MSAKDEIKKGERRFYPRAFPFVCKSCRRQRFRLQEDLQQHVLSKHCDRRITRKRRCKKRKPRGKRKQRPEGDLYFNDSCSTTGEETCVENTLQNIPFEKSEDLEEDEECAENTLSNIDIDDNSVSAASVLLTSKQSSSDSWLSEETMASLRRFRRFVGMNIEQSPNKLCKESRNNKLNEVVRFLNNNLPEDFRAKKVIMGGSFGRGTSIHGELDVEMIWILSRLYNDSVDSMKYKISDTLEIFCKLLRRYDQSLETTAVGVKFKILGHGDCDMDVYILPTCNFLERRKRTSMSHLPKGKRAEILNRMYSNVKDALPDGDIFAGTIAHLRRNFVRNKPKRVKALIRVVKYWRKSVFGETSDDPKLPSSYLFELVTIAQWEKGGRPKTFDLRKGLFSVLKTFGSYKEIQYSWQENYLAFPYVGNLIEAELISKPKTTAYVMDPANPYNNLMEDSTFFEAIVTRAREDVSSCFGDLHGITNIWT